MEGIYWTGNPFVDAGLSAISAITRVKDLKEIKPEHLRQASEELKRILLSDQSLGIGVEKSFVNTSLRTVFPNSELVNPSNWKGKTFEEKARNASEKFVNALEMDVKRAISCLEREGGNEVCLICGRRCFIEDMVIARKDKIPLLHGKVNFYSAFSFGVYICGICALAVRFLPMSIMGSSKNLWFLHTQDLSLSKKISEVYCWQHFNKLISKNESLSFFTYGEAEGNASSILYTLCSLLTQYRGELDRAFESPLPTTAYIFNNDNRGGFIEPIQIPNEILIFLYKLQIYSDRAFGRFYRELLQIPENLVKEERKERVKFVERISKAILNQKSIIGSCISNNEEKLYGGWIAHRLYMEEVMGLSRTKLAILEKLGIDIAQREDAKKYINELKKAESRDLYRLFLKYIQEGLLNYEEFYTLLPPNESYSASEIRDILLAVIYEWNKTKEESIEFPKIEEEPTFTPDEIVKRIQTIGEKLLTLPNPSRWIGELKTAKTTNRIRSRYLLAVQEGVLSFEDFLFLAPLNKRDQLWLLRDYLLAFLFDRGKDLVPKEEEITTIEESEDIEIFQR